jgi:hypothetical protein
MFIVITTSLHTDYETSKNIELNHTNQLTYITPDSVVGLWSVCSMKTGNSVLYFYSCPKVNFTLNGTGKIKMIAGEDEIFNWKLDNDTIYIDSSFDGNDSLFGDGWFLIKYEKSSEKLILKHVETDCSYILRRVEPK